MLNKLKQGIRTHHNKHMNVEISVGRGQGKKKGKTVVGGSE